MVVLQRALLSLSMSLFFLSVAPHDAHAHPSFVVGNKRYTLTPNKHTSQGTAQAEAQRMGGTLAYVPTAVWQQWLVERRRFFPSGVIEPVWIGLAGTRGRRIYRLDGEPFDNAAAFAGSGTNALQKYCRLSAGLFEPDFGDLARRTIPNWPFELATIMGRLNGETRCPGVDNLWWDILDADDPGVLRFGGIYGLVELDATQSCSPMRIQEFNGPPTVGQTYLFTVDRVRAGSVVAVYAGAPTLAPTPLNQCELFLAPPFVPMTQFTANLYGTNYESFNVPFDPTLIGLFVNVQAIGIEAGTNRLIMSNAISTQIQ